jgi:DNA invertase Pin-like site-specific DNA recombinase
MTALTWPRRSPLRPAPKPRAPAPAEQDDEANRKWGPLPDPKDCYVDSYTGTTFNRPGFQQLLKDALSDPQPADNPGRLEIYDPSRFGRPLKDEAPDTRAYRRMMWDFEEAGWILEFVSFDRSGDPMADELQILFHAYNASAFSVELSKKVRVGKAKHARDGYWIHGLAPLGTVRVIDGSIRVLGKGEKPQRGEQVVVTNRADLEPGQVEVGRVLAAKKGPADDENVILAGSDALRYWPIGANSYLDGASLQRVGIQLYDAGLRGYRGARLGHSAVRNFLSQPALVGRIDYTYRDHDGIEHQATIDAKWGPLVDVDLFEAVQKRLAIRGESQFAKTKNRESYPLAPVCAHCQSPYWGSNRPGRDGKHVCTLRHAPVDDCQYPERFAWSQQYGCIRYEIDAAEFEEAARQLIVQQRSTPEFETELRRMVHEEDTYRTTLDATVQNLRAQVRTLERKEDAAVDSLNAAKAEGKDLRSYNRAVEQAEAQLKTARSSLAKAARDQANAQAAWGRMEATIHETRIIDEAWDSLSLDERGVIFRHWVVASFIAVERIEGRKRGAPKHAIFYLAGTPREPDPAARQESRAAVISSLTPWSVSAESASSNTATAVGDPTLPSAQAECARTSGSASEDPDLSDGTAASSPQLPSATATLRRNPDRPARRKGEPRENASQPESSMDMRSISEGDAVPGCHPSAGSGSTPNGGSPAARAANAGSVGLCSRSRSRLRSRSRSRPFKATNFGPFHGHTS